MYYILLGLTGSGFFSGQFMNAKIVHCVRQLDPVYAQDGDRIVGHCLPANESTGRCTSCSVY